MNTISDIERIANSLGKAIKTYRGYKCLCPAHDDHDPSLDIDLKDNKILFKCRVGCSQEAVLENLKALKLWPIHNSTSTHHVRAFRAAPAGASIQTAQAFADSIKPKGYGQIIVYEYKTELGEPIYYRLRCKHPITGKKWIRPMYHNGNGFQLGEPKFNNGKSLYNLDQLHAQPNSPVWFVEGENKVEDIKKNGILATTSGSSSSASTVNLEQLRGRYVILWPDNDEPGRKYMEEIAKRLLAMRCTVSCIDVDKLDLQESDDVVDWLVRFPNATREDIEALPFIAMPEYHGVDWPEPEPVLSTVDRQPYPVDTLPQIIKDAVIEVQGFTQAPMALVASSAFTAKSTVLQAHFNVERNSALTSPISLFMLTIAESGERKTTCDQHFTSVIRAYEKEQEEISMSTLTKYTSEHRAWKAKKDGTEDAIKRAARGGKYSAVFEAKLLELQANEPRRPRVPRLMRQDETPENLAWALHSEWPSCGIISSEAGIVLGAHANGKDSITRNLAQQNVLWDGGQLSVGRRTTETYQVRGARLTVGLQIQELPLRNFIQSSKGLARGIGFFSRFLIAWPESTQGYRLYKEPPGDKPALMKFNNRMKEILNCEVSINENGELSPNTLTLSKAAKAAWVGFYNDTEQELKSSGKLTDVRDVASKAGENVARLAALFHVFQHGMACANTIEEDSLISAINCIKWHLNEALRFFGLIDIPEEVSSVADLDKWLINYCRERSVTSVPSSDVLQLAPSRLRKASVIQSIISELEELGRVRQQKQGRTKFIEVNPRLLANANSANLAQDEHSGNKD